MKKNMFRVHIVSPTQRTNFEQTNPIRLSYGMAISMAMTTDEARRLAAELNAAATKVYLESETAHAQAS